MLGDYFSIRFSKLYSLFLEQNFHISRLYSPEVRNFRFIGNLNDWKVDDFLSIMFELEWIMIREDNGERKKD